MISTSRSTYPAILKYIWLPILELLPFFHQICKTLILFVLYFKNYKRQVVNWNCKHVQHVKIYLPCNFEVNPITHFDRLCKLEKKGGWNLKKNLLLRNHWAHCNQTCEMILGWSPFKIVSVSAVLYPKWPPLLKIEISSNGQNCSILSQNVP